MNTRAEQIDEWKSLTPEERMKRRLTLGAQLLNALGVEAVDPLAQQELSNPEAIAPAARKADDPLVGLDHKHEDDFTVAPEPHKATDVAVHIPIKTRLAGQVITGYGAFYDANKVEAEFTLPWPEGIEAIDLLVPEPNEPAVAASASTAADVTDQVLAFAIGPHMANSDLEDLSVAIGLLPSSYRTLIKLVFVEQLNPIEISNSLGLSVEAVVLGLQTTMAKLHSLSQDNPSTKQPDPSIMATLR